MDKIDKFLKKLNKHERQKIKKIIQDILILNLGNLDIKKLSGYKNSYRIRIDKIRIKFKNCLRDLISAVKPQKLNPEKNFS